MSIIILQPSSPLPIPEPQAHRHILDVTHKPMQHLRHVQILGQQKKLNDIQTGIEFFQVLSWTCEPEPGKEGLGRRTRNYICFITVLITICQNIFGNPWGLCQCVPVTCYGNILASAVSYICGYV